ncbi:MlaC/ttg2D family ABC transporter substrate-binding protein [Parathalassolituus penaei]|uniref:ABC transporter substrate-binding protein n=1 Tax=Parathalassolituus penaei TaxID=2997323 RepID=A0A9X3IT54_9GAMM|nr:ABC transporter substrate-binding protein [Parathalassolituus penaei]MCY0965559.1 ABC transporter substrate-binding protein [Parathalassolituus penaei]
MIRMLALIMILLAPLAQVRAADSNELAEQAHEVVRRTTTKVMEKINANRHIYVSDKATFYWELEDVLGPMVDFRRLTRIIMGDHYFNASKEQRQRFALAFKRSLLSSYATGLIEFTDYEVRMLPPRKDFDHTATNTLVDLEVVTPSGKVFPITQSMYVNYATRTWMAQNVIVNGINVGKLFKDQFDELVRKNDGNIGAAIEDWIENLEDQGRELRRPKGAG